MERVTRMIHSPVLIDANMAQVLHDRYAHRLDEVFLRQPDGPTLTYRALEARASLFVGVLRDAGAVVGDRVVIQVHKSTDAVALYLACLRGGFVFVALNPAYTANEVSYFVDDAEPSIIVHAPHAPIESVEGITRAVFSLSVDGTGTLADAAAVVVPVDAIVPRSSSDLAAMLYTSGTTGRSKGATLSHQNLIVNGFALHDSWGFSSDDVLLHTLPIFHVHGLFVALHCAMLSACEVIFLPKFDPTAFFANLPEATVHMGVPTYYSRLVTDARLTPATCAHMRLFTSGSAPLSELSFEEFEALSGHQMVERYGMTEVGILTSNPLDADRVAGTVGYPLPGVEIRVTDEAGMPIADGSPGAVECRGPNVTEGYWRMPDKTAEATADGTWFRTGDVGTLAPDGRLTLAGRSSDMIISGGLNVYPAEIESCIEECDSVNEIAIVGLPHSDFGEAVTAFVVAHNADTVAEDVASACDGTIARFKHPKQVIVVDELPRNAMGKVQKSVLRQSFATFYDK